MKIEFRIFVIAAILLFISSPVYAQIRLDSLIEYDGVIYTNYDASFTFPFGAYTEVQDLANKIYSSLYRIEKRGDYYKIIDNVSAYYFISREYFSYKYEIVYAKVSDGIYDNSIDSLIGCDIYDVIDKKYHHKLSENGVITVERQLYGVFCEIKYKNKKIYQIEIKTDFIGFTPW